MSGEKPVRGNFCHVCGKTESVCFSFPKQPSERRDNWLSFCDVSNTDSSSISCPFLCSKHFEEKCILRRKHKTCLRTDAVPTIRIESSLTVQNAEEPPNKKSVKNCSVCGPTDCHLHRFPKDEVRKMEWLDALNMTGDQRKDLRVCDLHFPASCVMKTPKGRIVLKSDAKPIVIERKKSINIASSSTSASDSAMPGINLTQLTTPTTGTYAPIDFTRPALDTCVTNIESTACTSKETGFNQIILENIRQSVKQLLTTKRVDVESLKAIQPDTEVNISNPADKSENAALEGTMESTLECPLTETNVNNAALEGTVEVEMESETTETRTGDQSQIINTPTTSRCTPAKRRSIRYMADINTPSLESPVSRKNSLSIIRKYRLSMTKKVKLLQQENARLKKKVTNLKTLLADLMKKNMITENAATTLLVNFINSANPTVYSEYFNFEEDM